MKHILFILISLLLLLGGYGVYQFWPNGEVEALPLRDPIQLATWIGGDWISEPQTEMAIADLAEGLSALRVSDAFIYVSDLQPEGRFNPTYDYAATFTRTFKLYAPDIRLYAWLGVPVSVTDPDGSTSPDRLADPIIRQQIADFARRTVGEMGFDGVHLNAERIPNGDEAFLTMLDLLRTTLPPDTPLSTTSHALRIPFGHLSVPYPRIPDQTTLAYLTQIMARVDQVTLMAYDSGLLGPRDYRDWMQYQTWTAAAAAFAQDVEIYIGLPTSEEWTPAHQRAETLVNALAGFHAGYHPRIDGVALYPFGATNSVEWRQLHHDLSVDSIYNEP